MDSSIWWRYVQERKAWSWSCNALYQKRIQPCIARSIHKLSSYNLHKKSLSIFDSYFFLLNTSAVQCWPGVDEHVDYIWKYPKETDENGRTIYGGVKNELPIGGTNIYLSEDFRKILTGVIDVDSRGLIGPQEIEYAKRLGLNVTNVQL